MKSESIGDLAAALAHAQTTLKNAPKNAQNPHLRNRYADLASVRDTVIPALAKESIAVVQTFGIVPDGSVCVETTLLHASGQWLTSSLTMRLPDSGKQNPAQVLGSVISYLRRYALSAIAGIASDDDDDAEAAAEPAQPRPQHPDSRIGAARAAIAEASTVAELEAVGARLAKSPPDLRAAIMGEYADKLAALRGAT